MITPLWQTNRVPYKSGGWTQGKGHDWCNWRFCISYFGVIPVKTGIQDQ